MPEASLKDEIRSFLMASFSYQNHEFQDNEDIFATGFINSLFAMQLVTFVESTYQIRVESEDLNLDNFRTIDAIARLIESKR